MRRRVATILAAGVALAALGGCGDNNAPIQTISTDSETAASALSQDDFISGADSRCAEANSAIANLGSSDVASSVAIGQQLQITEEVLTGIQALGPPADSTGDLATFLKGLKSQVRILKQQQTAATSGDTATVDSLSAQLAQAESETEAAATSYGFDECGQPPSASVSAGGTAASPSATPVPATTTPVTPTTPVEPVPTEPAGQTGGIGGATTPTPTPTTPDDGSTTGSGGYGPG